MGAKHRRRKTLQKVILETTEQLRAQQYAAATIANYTRIWKQIEAFAQNKGKRYLSAKLTDDYWKNEGLKTKSQGYRKKKLSAIRILHEHAATGSHRHMPPSKPPSPLPLFMARALDAVLEYGQAELHWAKPTRVNHAGWMRKFMAFLQRKGLKSWRSLKSLDVAEYFISRAHENHNSNVQMMQSFKRFLKILFVRGILPRPLHESVPMPTSRRQNRLPSLWTAGEFEKTLAVIDRRRPTGKRDYAILLLASTLGIRTGDIEHLTLDDLNWRQACLEMVEGKTGHPRLLPLPDDVAEALIDYLQHGRPESSYREVFLRAVAPFTPLASAGSLYGMVKRYRIKAGLPLVPKRGLHSLRHVLATRLLRERQPLEIIGGILGHANLDTTRQYLRIDLEELRQAGLDPDGEVSHA